MQSVGLGFSESSVTVAAIALSGGTLAVCQRILSIRKISSARAYRRSSLGKAMNVISKAPLAIDSTA